MKYCLYLLTLCSVILSLTGCTSCVRSNSQNIVLAYYSSISNMPPDPQYFTHIAYAFAKVDSTLTNIDIQEPEKFKNIVNFKHINNNRKILLSLFGERNGNFSKMISSQELRKAFIGNCYKTMQEYRLDGFDIDWESPVTSKDKENFNHFIKELREKIGSNKIITIASSAKRRMYDFPSIIDYIDFVNVMTYDIAKPPFHHSPMAKSDLVKELTVPDAINHHKSYGIPKKKILLGIPLYGRGDKNIYRDFVGYEHVKTLNPCIQCWDSIAQVPYIADKNGNLVLTYDDSISVGMKCEFVKDEKLGGVMYWHYAGDGERSKLKKVIRDKFQLKKR